MKLQRRFELDDPQAPAMSPRPLNPPGFPSVPRMPQKLPVLAGQNGQLRRMVEDAIQAKLSSADMEIVCYLIRRAHGMGWTEGRERS